MFEDAAPVRRFAPQSWAASVFIHAVLISAVLLVRFPVEVPEAPARSPRVTLIAPPIHRTPRRVSKPPIRPAPRAFHAPVVSRMAPKPAPVLLSHPAIALPHPAPVLPDLPRAPLPPDRIQTGTFAASLPALAKPQIELPTAIRPAGFASAEISAQPGRGKSVIVQGTFGAAAVAESSQPLRTVKSGRFGDAVAVKPRLAAAGSRTAAPGAAPVEILQKPRPAYTEDARRLAIEGEVLLNVMFEASGRVRVLRLIRGLGHGLDASAMAAARRIRFRPALRNGVAVDSSAIVHIVFQLAY